MAALYMTVNGPKTVDQMNQELMAAGWSGPVPGTEGPGATANAYMQTTGGAVTEMAGQDYGAAAQSQPQATTQVNSITYAAPYSTTQTTGTGQKGVSPTDLSTVLSNLQAKAQQAYYNAKLNLDTDQEAYQKAAQQIASGLAVAGATGTYNGQPTQQAIKQLADIASQQGQTMLSYAQQFGTWGMPQVGQQTLAAQQQAFSQAQAAAQLTGWYTPYTYQAQQSGAVPPNVGLTAAPAQSGTAGTAGAYGGGATTGQSPFTAGNVLGAPAGYQPGQPVQTLAGQQQQWQQNYNTWTAQQSAAQNYLTLLSNLRGPADYAKYQQVLGSTPQGMKDLVAAAAGQYVPGGGATTGVQPQAANLQTMLGQVSGAQASGAPSQNDQAVMNTLVAPNQMAPQTWNNLTPSQQQLLLGQWESQGYTKDDAAALFKQSLPQYTPNTSMTAGTFKLQ